MQAIAKYTIDLLPKISNNVDMSDEKLVKLLEQFSQDCFPGVFGILQQELMTMSFVLQIYIICYIDVSAQQTFYKEVVKFFNNRIQHVHKELFASEYLSPQVLHNMNAWTVTNEFSQECMSSIFRVLTI